MKQIFKFILLCCVALSSAFLISCQTSMGKQFSQLQPGMDKHEVLELMGSPQRSERFKGKDRWTYVFYDQKVRQEKEVHFQEGKAIYVGDIWQPEPQNSAAVVDTKNSEENLKADQLDMQKKQEHQKAVSDYESQVKGQDKVLYVPQFTPIK